FAVKVASLILYCAAPSATDISSLSLHDALPISFRPLVADFLDPRYSRRDVLNRVKAELLRMKREPSPSSKRPLLRPLMRRKKGIDRKSTRLNSSHVKISYAVFCLKKKKPVQGQI